MVNARISVITKDWRVGAYLSTATGTGQPTLTCVFDQDAIDAEAASDGWYALLSNLPPGDADAAQALILYNGQRSGRTPLLRLQRPLRRRRPILQEHPAHRRPGHRHLLALLIFCLVERQARQALAAQDETKVEGLYARRPAIPTGRLIFQALATIKIIPGVGQEPPIIPQSTPLQLRLLDLLDIDPRQLR
jgi:hypothetical protein